MMDYMSIFLPPKCCMQLVLLLYTLEVIKLGTLDGARMGLYFADLEISRRVRK